MGESKRCFGDKNRLKITRHLPKKVTEESTKRISLIKTVAATAYTRERKKMTFYPRIIKGFPPCGHLLFKKIRSFVFAHFSAMHGHAACSMQPLERAAPPASQGDRSQAEEARGPTWHVAVPFA